MRFTCVSRKYFLEAVDRAFDGHAYIDVTLKSQLLHDLHKRYGDDPACFKSKSFLNSLVTETVTTILLRNLDTTTKATETVTTILLRNLDTFL